MTQLSPNAQLVSSIFDEVAKGNGAPFWEACLPLLSLVERAPNHNEARDYGL